ncbi:MAG: hypothetical protein H6744_05940 [Deltaproteobacteria bacterium]|nr:hypothetical protein [Deltaproteobacteria bacterium]MCB9786219.1 hypothetical protein [Deltaproteobacteria bacterium]
MSPTSPEASAAPFARRALAPALALGAVSLVAALVYGLCGEAILGPRSSGTDAFSRSLIGHHALVALLEATGVRTTVRRSDRLGGLGPGRALLIAEPTLDDEPAQDLADDALLDAIDAGADVFWVLPKWRGVEDHERPGFVARLDLLPAEDALGALNQVVTLTSDVVTEGLVRTGVPIDEAWTTPWGPLEVTLPAPQLLTAGIPDLTPVVFGPQGALVARHPSGVWVVSDPDLLNNAGIQRGDHALIARRLIADAAGASTLVVDEVVHGHARPPVIWVELATFPLVLVTLHALTLLLLFVWAGLARFGEPEPLPPRVLAGKATLIAVGAELLTAGADLRETLARYLALANASAASSLGLPTELSRDERDLRLAEIARERGLRDDPAALAAAVERLPHRRIIAATSLARRIHRLRLALEAPALTPSEPP